MTPQEFRTLAAKAGMTPGQLTNAAMRAVMVADRNDPRFALAWDVWTVGQEVEADDKRAQLCADGWVYYPRSMNATPMCCPNGHEAHLTGGKRPVWTCRICDMTQTGYEEDGANGYYLQWQVVKG